MNESMVIMMPPGRVMDALVGEFITQKLVIDNETGWGRYDGSLAMINLPAECGLNFGGWERGEGLHCYSSFLPKFSTDVTDAMSLLDTVNEYSLSFRGGVYRVSVNLEKIVVAGTLPLAICRALLISKLPKYIV